MKLIELHILQSFPVSCLNRDDVGAPKSATFGGVSRARLSSQCLKRAIREYAEDHALPGARFTGQRTKRLAEWIAEELTKQHKQEAARALEMGCAIAGALNKKEGSALESASPEMEALFYASPMQVKELAKLAIKEWGSDKKIAGAKDSFRSKCQQIGVFDAADIALFGRMVAADPSLTLEGAAMFSHALSTHKTDNDLDFFSALDDRRDRNEPGAAHIDTSQFNSAVYYRYAAVNLDLLFDTKHLERLSTEERKAVIAAFIKATVMAVPGARKNSMNGFVEPGFVLGSYKAAGQPIQLINAFEPPVKSKDGILSASLRELLLHRKNLNEVFEINETAVASTGTIRAKVENKADWQERLLDVGAIPQHLKLSEFIERLTSHVQ